MPSPDHIKKRWGGSRPPHSREKGGEGVTLPVCVKKQVGKVTPSPQSCKKGGEGITLPVRVEKRWGGSLPPPFASEEVGRVTPSPFAATSRQKTTIKKRNFTAHLCARFSAFCDRVVVVPVCLRVAVRKQEGRGGRKG